MHADLAYSYSCFPLFLKLCHLFRKYPWSCARASEPNKQQASIMAGEASKPLPWLPSFFQRSSDSKSSSEPHERSALLPAPRSSYLPPLSRSKQYRSESLLLLRTSTPVIVAYVLQTSLQTVSVLVVGRLSPESLATAAFSYMFAMSTGWLIGLGGTTALDTLASSSFTGSKNPHDLGVLLQRAFVVLTAMYIPVIALWLASASVFRALGQEEYICVQSAQFLRVLIPGGLGYIYFEALKKYMQAQGKKHHGP